MARRRKEKEPEPIPPPTHIAQNYAEAVTSRACGYIPGRPELDPFGMRQEIGSLRRDPEVLKFMVRHEDIEAELRTSVPNPDSNLKLKIMNREVEEFSKVTKDFLNLMLFDEGEERTDKLPFYLDTKKNRENRAKVRERALAQSKVKIIKKTGLGKYSCIYYHLWHHYDSLTKFIIPYYIILIKY